MRGTSLYIFFFITLMSCQRKVGLIEELMLESGKFGQILEYAEKHRVQIIYTQIDRDAGNNANFTTYRYRVDPKEYFYPASAIKLPMAALALEKVNDQHIRSFTPFSDMQIDSVFSGQSRVYEDSSSVNGKPSLGHYIKKLFLVSDNDAYNRLYEFVGQQEAHFRLLRKGYEDTRITHRLSIPLSIDENQCTNPMRFYQGDEVVYEQKSICNDIQIKSDRPIFIGKGYMKNGELINEPMEFTYKNAISLQSLHDVLLSIIFPERISGSKRFNLNKTDYAFLYEFMSKYPRESDYPHYGTEHEDDYCKFLMFGGTEQHIDRNIRIYNKIGQAYGFLIDMAYIVDFEKKVEFVLGAVIYVNENEILNDGEYEYEEVGYPFMRDLGQLFYDYEASRPREYEPDLNRYNWKLWEE